MSRGWKIAGWVGGALWAFFLVAITVTPHDVWQHLVAWWGVIVIGASFVVSAFLWVTQYLFGFLSFLHGLYTFHQQRKNKRPK